MPTLTKYFGIRVFLNWFDDDQHNTPHVHAQYGEDEISISLEGEVLAGSLPPKQLKQLRKLIAISETELQEVWDKAVAGEPIEGAEFFGN